MTPGISNKTGSINDQNYRSIKDVDTNYIIVGRSLYNSKNIEETIKQYM